MNQSFKWSPEVYLSIIPFTTGTRPSTGVEFILEYAQCNLISHHHPTTSPSLMVLLKLGLCLLVPNRNAETVLGEVEKSSFYCFARQRGPQWANALNTMWPILEGVVRSVIVFKEQGVIVDRARGRPLEWLASR